MCLGTVPSPKLFLPAVAGVTFRYQPDLPPAPPAGLWASAGNGSVSLRWNPSSESDVRGYMVYYGYASGNYFGADALEGPSPILKISRTLRLMGFARRHSMASSEALPPTAVVLTEVVRSLAKRSR